MLSAYFIWIYLVDASISPWLCVFFFRFLLYPYIVFSPVAFLVTAIGLLSHGWGFRPSLHLHTFAVLDCVHLFIHVHILNLSFIFFHYWLWKTPSIHSPNCSSSVEFDVLLVTIPYYVVPLSHPPKKLKKQQQKNPVYLILADLDGFGGIVLTVKVNTVDGVFVLHSIIHVNYLKNNWGKLTKNTFQYSLTCCTTQNYFKLHFTYSFLTTHAVL